MYNQEVVQQRLKRIRKDLGIKLKVYSVQNSIDRQSYLADLWDERKGGPRRELTVEESDFCRNEILLCKWDFNYFAPRYAFVNSKTEGLKRIEFWESQQIALDYLSRGELEAWQTGSDNLWAWLKARQLGATQVCESMVGHRLFFHENQRAVIASDEPDHSLKLSRRVELIFKHLPWWMKPQRQYNVKGVEMFFDKLNSALTIGHGRKEGGGLAQGDTTNIFHLTEIPDWENDKQIDADFLPTVPLHPTSVGFVESTGRGRGNYWHDLFTQAWQGKHERFKAIFIPYYTETSTYRAQPPADWTPSPIALAHAEQVKADSPQYCHGRTVELTKEQLYWWDKNYHGYKARNDLSTFFQEYSANHLESFQQAGTGMFNNDLCMEMMQNCGKPTVMDILI